MQIIGARKNISQTADWVSASIFIKIRNITLRKTMIEVVFFQTFTLQTNASSGRDGCVEQMSGPSPTATTSITTMSSSSMSLSISVWPGRSNKSYKLSRRRPKICPELSVVLFQLSLSIVLLKSFNVSCLLLTVNLFSFCFRCKFTSRPVWSKHFTSEDFTFLCRLFVTSVTLYRAEEGVPSLEQCCLTCSF